MGRRTAILLGAVAVVTAGLALGLFVARPNQAPPSGVLDTLPPEEWAGVEWVEVSGEAPNGPSWSSIYDARRVGGQLLASGYAGGLGEHDVARSSIWRSTDGIAWTGLDVTLDGESGFVPANVALGPAGLLSTGYSEREKGTILAGSADGASWTALARPGPGVDMHLVVGTDSGYATGGYTDVRPTSWITGDGRDWTELPIPDARDSLQLNDLVSSRQGIHLAGQVTAPGVLRPVLWRLDGEVWTPVDVAHGGIPDAAWVASIDDLVPFHGGVFAVGRSGPAEGCPGDAGVASAALDLVDDGKDPCPWPPPAAWMSVDGQAWREAALPVVAGVDPDQAVYSIASGGAGLIALVLEGEAADVGAEAPTWGLWTSADGNAWTRIGDAMRLRLGSYYHRFVAMPGRVIVLGDDGQGRAMAWVGRPAP
jgi:hypothetical protein